MSKKEKKVKLTKAEKKAAKKEKKAAKKANRGKNPEVSKAIISSITALVCVIAIVLTSVSITDKICSTNVEIAEKYSGGGSSADGFDDFFADMEDEGGVPAGSEAPVGGAPAATDPNAAADPNAATPNGGATPTTPGQPSAATPTSTAPSTTADIIKYYNTAINKAVSSKAGFSKTRKTTLGTLKGAEAIMKISIARDAVNNFLGVGTKEYTNKKGTADNISKSALTEADVKQAKCTVSGTTYTISLLLADGTSTAPSVSDTSPLQRCGLYAGAGDKSAYDYKSANNIYVSLNGAENAGVEKVVENTKNAKIVVKIDSTTGNIIALQAAFDWIADLTNVKYTFVKISGTGDAQTTVSFKNFVY